MEGALQYLELVANFPGIDLFGIFRSFWVLFYARPDLFNPPFLPKIIDLSLSHLVPAIFCPKVGLNVCHFEVFCTTFLIDFRYS